MLLSMIQYLPHVLASTALCAIALVGWRRTRATGAFLISVGAGVQIVYQGFWLWGLSTMFGGRSYVSMSLYSGMQAVGGIIASVLLIVGVALLIARLPTAQRRE